MPIPFILAGVALAAGAYGVKKGLDAKSDFDDASETNERAQRIYDQASRELERTREATQESLNDLGELKLSLYENRLTPFVAAFKQIHNIDFQHDAIGDELQLAVSENDMAAIETAVLKMTDVVSGGVVSLGAGGLAGLAAYGSVGLLASASTGTAIASLSGVAATNATLAWLGGGALSAGGFGMAGGTAVLGGIVAGPVLAVGGMLLAAKAEEAKHNAYANLNLARKADEQMATAKVATQGIHTRVQEVYHVLGKLEDTFEPILAGLQSLVMRSPKDCSGKVDYMTLQKQDQIGVMMSMMLAKTIKNVLETPLINQEGLVTSESANVINSANHELTDVQEKLALARL